MVRPAHGMSVVEAVRPSSIELAAGAADEVVDPVVTRMLKIVLVSVEDDAHARAREERQQYLHPIGIVVIRARAERRVMTEHEFPASRLVRRERLIHPFPVFRVLEQALALEEILLGGVDAEELDVASVAEPVKKAWIH